MQRNPFGRGRATRRQFVTGTTALAGSVAIGATFPKLARSQSEKVVSLLSWPGHGAQDVIGPFEAATGIKVQSKEYTGGEEMIALLQSSPPGTFDVVLSDAEYIYQLQQAGLIDEMNPGDYPIDDFWPEFQKFPYHWVDDKLYSVMVDYGFLGMVYNTEKLTREEVDSYSVLWEEKVKGKVGMYDWYLPNMMCLSLYDGNHPPNDVSPAQFEKLKKTLFSLSGQMSGIGPWSSVFSQLTNEESWVMPGVGAWAALLLENDGVPIKAMVPKEGGLQWTESLSIASSSENKDLGVQLIQYLTSPEGQVLEATKSAYWASIPNKMGWKKLNEDMPEAAVRLEHELDKRNVMDEFAEGKISIRGVPAQQSIEDWNEAWTEFKNM
ncbi:MAG: extracellular solute-binding protein [Alphaproteobacteria bacterium]|nr:extracellular solute-binding protein [Alphaproteobacteria bacterium]